MVILFGLLGATAAVMAQDAELPYYVGQSVCLECHSSGQPAHSCSLEPIPKHARSFQTLHRPEAVHIAAVSGVPEPPTENRICLECHATASDVGPRWTRATFNIADGVQCEACHDAGSLHVEAYRSLEGERNKGTSQHIRKSDQTKCTSCHRPRESHRLVLDSGYRIPRTDLLYKTPVNLAISPDGNFLYVVCEHSNSLVVVDLDTGRVAIEIAVGRRPHDVAVSPDGRTLYVTNRLSDSLSVIDAASRRVVREITVGDEPHGVLTDASGRFVYVLNTAQDCISVIDAASLRETKRLVAGRGPWSLALSPDGRTLDITNAWPEIVPFRDPPRSEITTVGVEENVVSYRRVVPEANMLHGIAAVPGDEITLFTLVRTKNLVPITRLGQGWTITNGLGVLWSDGRVDQVLLDEPNAAFPDPTDVAVTPDGRYALVTSGGADQVAVVDVNKLKATIIGTPEPRRRDVLPNHLGMSGRFVLKRIEVGSNPRGVIISPDGRFAYVACALDDAVTIIETAGFTVVGRIDLGGPGEITEIRRGEKLFHSARATFGRQFSCRSCHPDGHVNGLTFDIEADGLGMDPVDNRTLRGILDTAPFKWEGTNPTLSRQCGPRLAVFFTRLDPFTPTELEALVRYISTIERPPNRHRHPDGLTPAQRRGKAVFERVATNSGEPILPERRCNTCHNGPYKTDGTKADVGTTMWFDAPIDVNAVDVEDLTYDVERYGELGLYYFVDTGTPTRAFDTPHLNNIYDSAPYLHNGAAATLEEIWTRFDVLTLHGATGDLTRRQINDLIAYLKAL